MRNLADHYADALVDVALDQNAAAEIRKQLGDFLELLGESPELRVLSGKPGGFAKQQTSGGGCAGGAPGGQPDAAEFPICSSGPAAHGAAAGNSIGLSTCGWMNGKESRAPT